MVMSDTRLYLAVALGSALGALARYGVSLSALTMLGPAFAWGTLAANVLGSWLIGFYAALAGPDGRFRTGPVAQQFFMAGFCGGFTTFSIFSLETLLLLEAGRAPLAGVYVVTSVLLWLAAVWAGYALGRSMDRR
jgi:fluoride exporter